MSESRAAIEMTLEELEKEITCAICHEHYAEPKVLPCCHYYCKDCIHTLALRKGIDKPFSCPECRTDTTLPQGGVASLKPAFFINHMKEVHSKLSRAQGKVEATCESCSDGDKAEAKAFCRQCTQFICDYCVQSHHKLKVFAGHKTVSLEELKKGGAKDIVVEQAPLQTCPDHDEQMKIYCFDCSRLICRDCTIKDHNGHNHEFIKKAAPKVKKEILEKLGPLKEVKESLSHAVEEIQTTKSEVEAQVDTVTINIESSFEELQRILAHRKQQLIKEAVATGAEKLEHLSGQEKQLSTSCAVVQSVIEYTEQCVGHSAADDIMSVHTEIQSRIEGEIAERKCDNLYPVEEADIGVEVSCMEDLMQLCQTKAKLTQPITTEVTVAGEGIISAEVNKTSQFSVTAKLGDGKQIKHKFPLECHLVYLADGSITKCEVDRSNNECLIRYTPTVHGRHEVHVTAPGLEIPGNPFPVFVSIHPTQLVKPVKVISEGFDEEPLHVAINSAGEMVMTGKNSVVIFNSKGEKTSSVNLYEEHEINPWSVAVDSDDVVYIVGRTNDNTKSCIIKLTSELKISKRSIEMHTEFREIAVIGDELVVCNEKDNRIMIFNPKEFNLVKHFKVEEGLEFKFIRDVSADNHGKLYVCGWNASIQVFSISGKFMRSFHGKNLASPRGICVAGDYVYLTDTFNNDILVYTTDGEYITSLKMQSEYDFLRPWGVRADKSGFIYICDSGNKKLVIF